MSARAARGFTLVELLVSMVVAAIVIAGSLTLLVAQQRAFRSSAADRALQEGARTALADLTTNLRRAGYGIEPWLALDLGPVANARPSWTGGPVTTTNGYPAGAPSAAAPPCAAPVPVTDRDSVTGPDDLVFHARDPAFNRQLAAAPSTAELRFTEPLGAPLLAGQILQVMCGGAGGWAYVTVGRRAEPGADRVALSSACAGGFPYQQALLESGCFSAGFANARVFKVDRFHYYVDRFAGRPYLMLDRGLRDGGAAVVEPVAPDVEDLQVAYVFPASVAAPRVGGPGEARLARSAASIDLDAVPPVYEDASFAASRLTNHPANVRAVQLSVVMRTATADAQLAGPEFATLPAAANRPAITAGVDAGHRRLVVETTEAVRNLDSRGPYFPAYGPGLNVGGG